MKTSPASLWRLAIAFVLLSPPVAAAQSRVEQGRELLAGVRAVHLLIDFGLEALEPEQWRFFDIALGPSRGEQRTTLGCDEWQLRKGTLELEQLGRDLIAGRPVPDADAKRLDEYFSVPRNPVRGYRMDVKTARLLEKANRRAQRRLQKLADRLAAEQPLTDDELAMVRARWARFRSGDQLNWDAVELSLDIPRLVKAYSSADLKSRHAIRVLFGRRGKTDEQAVAFILDALKGDTPIERYDAALVAGKMRPASDRLISALIGSLDDPDPRVARAAVRSLLFLNARQSAPSMLRRLKRAATDRTGAAVDEELGFAFEDYDISDSHIGFRHDLPTELMFALGRFEHCEAIPLLWEIVRGKGRDVWQYYGIHELDHGGVAFEAIVDIGAEEPATLARRALADESATVDALGAAANVLGESGQAADIPLLLPVMSRLDEAARAKPHRYSRTDRSMSRVTFAIERLLYFADPDEPSLPEIRRAALAELRRCSSGPFGKRIIAALGDFDPDHVEATALALAADTKADPDARRVATEILGRSKDLRYIEPLLAVFQDNGNTTNGSVGLHAAWATSEILAVADHDDPAVATLVQRVGDKLERIAPGTDWVPPRRSDFREVLIRVDSDRGVRACSAIALDEKRDDLERSIALDDIARGAKPNRDLAMPLRPLLDLPLADPLETTCVRSSAVTAMATLLGLEWKEDDPASSKSLEQRVRSALGE